MAMLAGAQSVCELAAQHGVSRQTAYKYRRQFLRSGPEGLEDQRRGPPSAAAGRWQPWYRQVLRWRRRKPKWGAHKLRWRLRHHHPARHLPSVRTMERWLRRAGLTQPRRRRRHQPRWPSAAHVVRRSNEVWTFDWKGWFRTGDGQRIEPLTIRDLASRFILWNQPLPQRTDQSIRRVCRRLFRRYGLPRAIRTDLGVPFCSHGPYRLTSLSLWWHRLGIRVEFVDRQARVHNNAHEQMHRILKEETASPPAATYRTQCHRLRRWRWQYNHERAHAGLGEIPPALRYRPRPQKLPALRLPSYPAHWLVAKVRPQGHIRLRRQDYQVGRAFAGLPIGCQPHHHGFKAYFARLFLGELRTPVWPNPVKKGRD